MSKVGITIFVKVWRNHVSPNFSLTMLCKNLPSYFDPVNVLTRFAAEANGDLYNAEGLRKPQKKTVIETKKITKIRFKLIKLKKKREKKKKKKKEEKTN